MSHNKMALEFFSKSENEGFARVSVAAFIAQLDPTMDEISDVKTAVSELQMPLFMDMMDRKIEL